MNTLLKQIINTGVNFEYPTHIARRVRPTNILAVLYFFLAALPFFVISIFYLPPVTLVMPGMGMVVCITALVLNRYGKIHASRIILTAQLKAEEMLRINERALNSTNIGVVITDTSLPDNPIIYANPANAIITGYESDEIIGKNCRFLQKDDVEQQGVKDLKAAIENDTECKVVIRNYRKDGTLFWNELSISPVYDLVGKVTHFVGFLNDITSQMEAEKALKESKDKLLQINEELKDFAHIVSHDLKAPLRAISSLSQWILQDNGNKLNEEGKAQFDLLSGRVQKMEKLKLEYDIAASVQEAREKLAANHFDVIIADYMLGDGNAFDVLDLGYKIPLIFTSGVGDEEIIVKAMKKGAYDDLIKDTARNYLKVLPLTIEKTIKRSLADQRLIAVEEELKQLSIVASKTSNAVIIFDCELKIEWVNEAFCNMSGYSFLEVRGTYGEKIRSDRQKLFDNSKIQLQVLKNKKSFTYQTQNSTKQGVEYWALTTLTPIMDVDGQIHKVIAIESNITASKKVEKELIVAKEKAEESKWIKEEFLANMSHEIRTPLNGIKGFTDLIAKNNKDPNQEKYLQAIQFSTPFKPWLKITVFNSIADERCGVAAANFIKHIFTV